MNNAANRDTGDNPVKTVDSMSRRRYREILFEESD